MPFESLTAFNSEEAIAEEPYLTWSQIVTTSCRCRNVTGMLPERCRDVAGKLRDIARTFAKFWIETLFWASSTRRGPSTPPPSNTPPQGGANAEGSWPPPGPHAGTIRATGGQIAHQRQRDAARTLNEFEYKI